MLVVWERSVVAHKSPASTACPAAGTLPPNSDAARTWCRIARFSRQGDVFVIHSDYVAGYCALR